MSDVMRNEWCYEEWVMLWGSRPLRRWTYYANEPIIAFFLFFFYLLNSITNKKSNGLQNTQVCISSSQGFSSQCLSSRPPGGMRQVQWLWFKSLMGPIEQPPPDDDVTKKIKLADTMIKKITKKKYYEKWFICIVCIRLQHATFISHILSFR
jgi:hypothetical protein